MPTNATAPRTAPHTVASSHAGSKINRTATISRISANPEPSGGIQELDASASEKATSSSVAYFREYRSFGSDRPKEKNLAAGGS